MATSDYLENKILDHVLNSTTYTGPTTLYLALFTTTSTGLEANNPTNEISTAGSSNYAREVIDFDAASAGECNSTSGGISFAQAGTDWGTIRYIAIVDHASNTNWGTDVNVLFHGQLSADKIINTGDTLQLAGGAITIALT